MSRTISLGPRSKAPRAPSIAPRKSRRPVAIWGPNRPVLGDEEFSRLSHIIHEGLGMRAPAAKRAMLEARILVRLRPLGLRNFAEYCDLLLGSPKTSPEMIAFLDMATTNETAFFREPEQLDALAAEQLPELADAARRDGLPIRVWSAACSNGAEVWTLAMLIDDLRTRRGEAWTYEILGSDVCSEVLGTAAGGTYPAEALEPVPSGFRQRYLLRSKDKGLARIGPILRGHASFRRINLIDEDYQVVSDLDLVFLRNVLIYFDPGTKVSILEKVCSLLRPGGILCVGVAENLRDPKELGLERLGTSRFRKAIP